MESSEKGRVVVLTGANEGIGYNILKALVEDGYRVAGLDVRGDAIESLHESYPEAVRYFDCDVTAEDDVDRSVEEIIGEWGQIDILVNNAAVLNFGFFEDKTPQDMERVFEVNFFGYVRLIRAVFRI